MWATDASAEKKKEMESKLPGMPKVTHTCLQKTFTHVEYQQPHWKRRKAILEAHPEIEDLHEVDPSSALWTLILVTFMYWSAYTMKDYNWWVLFAVAYCVGAFADHALWVLIHDFGHDTAFHTKWLNAVFLLITNIPHIFPSGITFKYYHKQHHIHLSETYEDPDIPGPFEQKLFGTTSIGKMGHLFFFPFVQVLRTIRYGPMYWDAWVILNYLVNIPINGAVLYFWGPGAFFYLVTSFYFAIGLHPVGARWIAEHYAFRPEQETYSYYGPLNYVAFNVGYHNEHHDFPRVAWSKLPTVTKIAHEFYDPLYSHPSYLGLLWEFFFNPNFTLQSRIVRDNRSVLQSVEDAYEGQDLKKKL